MWLYYSDGLEAARNIPLHLVKLNSNLIELLKLGNNEAHHCHLTKPRHRAREKSRDQRKEWLLAHHPVLQMLQRIPITLRGRCRLLLQTSRSAPACAYLLHPMLHFSAPQRANLILPFGSQEYACGMSFAPIILDKWNIKITVLEVAKHRISSIGFLISYSQVFFILKFKWDFSEHHRTNCVVIHSPWRRQSSSVNPEIRFFFLCNCASGWLTTGHMINDKVHYFNLLPLNKQNTQTNLK